MIHGLLFALEKGVKALITEGDSQLLNRQVKQILKKGLIRESFSPCTIPIMLAPKRNGEWRICTNSRVINKITVRYRFTFPRIDVIIDSLNEVKYFTT